MWEIMTKGWRKTMTGEGKDAITRHGKGEGYDSQLTCSRLRQSKYTAKKTNLCLERRERSPR